MKSIIKTICILIIPIIIISIINIFLQKKIINDGLELGTNDKFLIIGDSHGTCSFDTKYISSTKNLSNYGESLVFSYYKLKRILENNPTKKDLKLIISLSYHCIYPCRENYKNPEQRTKILQEYYPILDNEGQDLIGKNGVDFYLTKIKYDLGIPLEFSKTIKKFNFKKTLIYNWLQK